jgi:hypothetical protein
MFQTMRCEEEEWMKQCWPEFNETRPRRAWGPLLTLKRYHSPRRSEKICRALLPEMLLTTC